MIRGRGTVVNCQERASRIPVPPPALVTPDSRRTLYFCSKSSLFVGVKTRVLPWISRVPSICVEKMSPRRPTFLRLKRSFALSRSIGMLKVMETVVSIGTRSSPSSGLTHTLLGGCVEKVQVSSCARIPPVVSLRPAAMRAV